MQYEHTVDISAAPDAVWRVLADIEHWPNWTSTMITVEAPAPFLLHVGLRARVKQPGLRPNVLTVKSLEEGRRFLWISKQPGLTFIADHVIAATP